MISHQPQHNTSALGSRRTQIPKTFRRLWQVDIALKSEHECEVDMFHTQGNKKNQFLVALDPTRTEKLPLEASVFKLAVERN